MYIQCTSQYIVYTCIYPKNWKAIESWPPGQSLTLTDQIRNNCVQPVPTGMSVVWVWSRQSVYRIEDSCQVALDKKVRNCIYDVYRLYVNHKTCLFFVSNMYIHCMYMYYKCTGNVYTKPLRLEIVYTCIHCMYIYRQCTYKYLWMCGLGVGPVQGRHACQMLSIWYPKTSLSRI